MRLAQVFLLVFFWGGGMGLWLGDFELNFEKEQGSDIVYIVYIPPLTFTPSHQLCPLL